MPKRLYLTSPKKHVVRDICRYEFVDEESSSIEPITGEGIPSIWAILCSIVDDKILGRSCKGL